MSDHYVYLYRSKGNAPVYVGYGEFPKRATEHARHTHNAKLEKFLEDNEYSLSIAGPFDSKQTGLAVEAAMISALNLCERSGELFNEAPGSKDHRFRPYGVPSELVDRLSMVELDDDAIRKAAGGEVLMVLVNSKDFKDRPGYDPADPPTEKEILERMQQYWPLNAALKRWRNSPWSYPKLLVGVTGSRNSRIVIGAIPIEPDHEKNWQLAKCEVGGKSVMKTIVPVNLESAPDLDACKLRGRKLVKEITFTQSGLRKRLS